MKELDKVYAQNIANEYVPKTESKIVALKKLDAKVKRPARIFGIAFGIVSTLVLGTGMSFAMGVIGGENGMVLGVIIGLIGIVGVSVNYPIYQKILGNRKAKYASDIVELARQITQ